QLFDCSQIGENMVTVVLTDDAGNSSSKSVTVNVIDDLSPEIITKEATVSLNEYGEGSITLDDVYVSSQDNCDIASVSLDISDFNCNNLGQNIVNITVVDVNENTSISQAVVTVIDAIAPLIYSDLSFMTKSTNGKSNSQTRWYDFDYSATDNCDPDPEIKAIVLTTIPDGEVIFTVSDQVKIKIEAIPNGNIEIEGPDPIQIYNDLLANGGVLIDAFRDVMIKESPSKFEFKYNSFGELTHLFAPEVAIKLIAVDKAENSAEEIIAIVFPPSVSNNKGKGNNARTSGNESISVEDDLSINGYPLSWSVFPNPFLNESNILFESKIDSEITVHVFNMLGQKLHTQQALVMKGNNRIQIENSEKWSSGGKQFLLRIITSDGHYLNKLLIKKD
ncbi:MAG: T9SS type A sorting domain-containing protein, partial [Cyclobacteriaceae bacterium]|nr:T9SS type A sorting domain-containing protein [Cyclobacteriaceae bacterium]